MKKLLALLLLLSTPVFAQSTANPVVLGTLTVSGCPSVALTPCWKPISVSNPLAISTSGSSSGSVAIASTTSNVTYSPLFAIGTSASAATIYLDGTSPFTYNASTGLVSSLGLTTTTLTVNGNSSLAGTTTVSNLTVTGTCTGCGSSGALSGLTAAITTNSINNAANAQTWAWNTLTTQTAFALTSTSLTTGKLLDVEQTGLVNSTGYGGYFNMATTGAGYALYAQTTGTGNTGYGVYASNPSSTGYALYANGNTKTTGTSTYTGSMFINGRNVTAAGAITISATTDYFICVNKTVGAATTANLPPSPAIWALFIVKDCKGDAAANNITVKTTDGSTIDGGAGATGYVINSAYGLAGFVYNGTNWFSE